MKPEVELRKLAQILLKRKKIDRAGFDTILASHDDSKKRRSPAKDNGTARNPLSDAIQFIARLNITSPRPSGKPVTEETVQTCVAAQYGVQFKKLDPLDLDIDVVTRTIPKPFALRHMALPLYISEGRLVVAVVDPECHDTIDAVRRVTGREVDVILATPSEIHRLIHEFFGFKASVSKAEEQMGALQIDLGNLEQLNRIGSPDQIQTNDEHVKNAVDYLFHNAFNLRASDIHIEPKRDNTIVRFRIDGMLHDVHKIPRGVSQAVASRIKMLSRMNIAEKRRPQDGRIRLETGDSAAEIRVSTMPTAFGEKLVMRVLKPESLLRDMEQLGFYPEDLIKVERALNRPHGIMLVTGPTGSGKTTTLYSALNLLAAPDKNIVTVEDPIETIVEHFNQVAVQPSVDVTFATSLRTILRQDPDIIMIGEIRDHDTAENAVQAALTGHLVLSTLHTNDTASSVTRLADLGVAPFLINSTLIGVLAQRLIRMVCPSCAKEMKVTKRKLAQFGISVEPDTVTIREGAGCEECRFTGFFGRTGVYEMLEVDDQIAAMVGKGAGAMEIRAHALRNGMTSMKQNAVRKMLDGVTSVPEVVRLGQTM